MPQKATATLCAHSGAVKISRGDLVSIPTPPRTLTFTPVPHSLLVDLIEARLDAKGLCISKSEFAVQSDGQKLFAALTLAHQTKDDFSFAMAIRASNDKSMPIELVAGLRVFICDNMALSGDSEILCRKHTSRLDIRGEIFSGVDRAIARFFTLDQRIAALKDASLSDVEAKALILDAAVKEVMPLRLIPSVAKNYLEPPHTEFEPRTQWSLHNAFTESFKELRPNIALDATQELGTLFQI
jgi:hypothetical protein